MVGMGRERNQTRRTLKKPSPGKSIPYLVSYLEMDGPPARHGWPAPSGFSLQRIPDPEVDDFRRLYDAVGADYAWTDMHAVPPKELAAFVQSPLVEFFLLLDPTGMEAGFFQLDYRLLEPDGVAEISFFGLLPVYRGRGIGRWLLGEAIRLAWERDIRRLDVNTCTLDHPVALTNYLRAGFRVAREESHTRHGESTGWRAE